MRCNHCHCFGAALQLAAFAGLQLHHDVSGVDIKHERQVHPMHCGGGGGLTS
jgi:hypothetical protein